MCIVLAALLSGCSAPGSEVADGGAGSPAPSVSVAGPAPAGTTGAAGTVLPTAATTYAAGVTAPPAGRPSAVVDPYDDGCDRSYGTAAQCIPEHAPGGVAVTCAFLAAYGYLPLLLVDDHLGVAAAPGVRTDEVDGQRYLTGCGP